MGTLYLLTHPKKQNTPTEDQKVLSENILGPAELLLEPTDFRNSFSELPLEPTELQNSFSEVPLCFFELPRRPMDLPNSFSELPLGIF
ncbi:hypothetical protein DF185_03665 [Marinifilum breve]|uniref:Uncharacterized protein n=2 Tax=Marinifilum breve TaxID=2184082 RepID=A0A2V4A3M4_9BACT|nr:hypothetical protein DF185_03665 [Marinifilum breve]